MTAVNDLSYKPTCSTALLLPYGMILLRFWSTPRVHELCRHRLRFLSLQKIGGLGRDVNIRMSLFIYAHLHLMHCACPCTLLPHIPPYDVHFFKHP